MAAPGRRQAPPGWELLSRHVKAARTQTARRDAAANQNYWVAVVHVPVTLEGTSLELSRSPTMVVKTWSSWVIGTAPLHMVLVCPFNV